MNENHPASNPAFRAAHFIRNSVTLKILSILFLSLLLLIPTAMVEGLIRERQFRKQDVIREISTKWGNEQSITGPFITVPYRKYFEDDEGKRKYNIHYLHFLPDDLTIQGRLTPEVRYRGIYKAILYNAKLTISGTFPPPPVSELNVPTENIIWDGAYMGLGLTDLRGIRELTATEIDGAPVSVDPGLESNDIVGAGVSVKVSLKPAGGDIPFRFSLDLNGSQRLLFVPVGRDTQVVIISEWTAPSFDGAFLPSEREIRTDGFTAKWKVLHLNRNFPQFWEGNRHQIAGAAFGVKLFEPVDIYQKANRTAKYAVMFIGFTFLAFFFSEVMNRRRLHPIQYLLVGLAIIVFYTLLLSISEHLNFDGAYLIASVAIISLITGYSDSILKNRRMTVTIGGLLVILYAYLYLVLQQEDFALLMGSIGLFAVLAGVMYMTRGIDWYRLSLGDGEN